MLHFNKLKSLPSYDKLIPFEIECKWSKHIKLCKYSKEANGFIKGTTHTKYKRKYHLRTHVTCYAQIWYKRRWKARHPDVEMKWTPRHGALLNIFELHCNVPCRKLLTTHRDFSASLKCCIIAPDGRSIVWCETLFFLIAAHHRRSVLFNLTVRNIKTPTQHILHNAGWRLRICFLNLSVRGPKTWHESLRFAMASKIRCIFQYISSIVANVMVRNPTPCLP